MFPTDAFKDDDFARRANMVSEELGSSYLSKIVSTDDLDDHSEAKTATDNTTYITLHSSHLT